MAKVGVEKGDNFWPKSKVIAWHFDSKFTGLAFLVKIWIKMDKISGRNWC